MLIAVDVGTSGIKAVVFDRLGREANVIRRAIAVDRPRPGWAEQDMTACWALVCDALREAAASAGQVDFVAVTAQGDGCWLVDEAGEPVRPAILWNDARAHAYVDGWLADGTLARGFDLNGSVTFAGLANAALRWLGDNEPDSLARTRSVLTCGSWIFSRLTGITLAEISDASAPFLDPCSGSYSDALLELYDLAAIKKMLPPVASGADAVAKLSAEAATAIGLPEGTPVVLAPYDVASAALGAGARLPGDAVLVLGTTFLCGAVTAEPTLGGAPSGLTVALGFPGRFRRLFPTLAGMEVLEWAARLLGLPGPREAVELAASAERGARGLCFLPYLSPAGERAPFLDPAARGSLWNLSLEHSPADISRATVEGLTMVLRDCIAALPARPSRLYLSGGGSNSAPWRQLIADATGVEVVRVRASEVTARGAAFAGMIATGMAEPDALAEAWRDEGEACRPDADAVGFYDDLYEEFRRLRELARQGWRGANGGGAG